LPLFFTISLSILSILFSEFTPNLLIKFKYSTIGYNIFSFFNQRFYIELIYNKYIVENILTLGGQTTKSLDKGSVEYLGPYGLEKGLLNLSNSINNLSTGVVTTYALYILMGLIFYITSLYFFNWDSNLLILIIFSLFVILNNKFILQR